MLITKDAKMDSKRSTRSVLNCVKIHFPVLALAMTNFSRIFSIVLVSVDVLRAALFAQTTIAPQKHSLSSPNMEPI